MPNCLVALLVDNFKRFGDNEHFFAPIHLL